MEKTGETRETRKKYMCFKYPNPAHRPCGDIDIWLYGEQEKGDKLLQKKGIAIDSSHHHHTVFHVNGVMVENHYDFINIHAHLSSRTLEQELLKDVCGIKVHIQHKTDDWEEEPPYFNSNYHQCTILVAPKFDSLPLLLSRAGIETKRLYKPLHTFPEHADFPRYTDGVCETLYECGLCLPSGMNVTDDDVRYISKQIKDIVQKRTVSC